MKKLELIETISHIINYEIRFHEEVSSESKQELVSHIGHFDSYVDDYISKFLSINEMITNGGVPILKEIYSYFESVSPFTYEEWQAVKGYCSDKELVKRLIEDGCSTRQIEASLNENHEMYDDYLKEYISNNEKVSV